MGKVEQLKDDVPGMSPQTEASKLLEQALMQMDGIISGNASSLTAHSPDYGFASTTPAGVRDAANALVSAIQSVPGAPPPDPNVAKVLMCWLQQSFLENMQRDFSDEEEDEVTFLLRLKPAPTPPVRRRRPDVHPQQPHVPKSWDVVIERRDAYSPPSPATSRRFSLDSRVNPAPPSPQRRSFDIPEEIAPPLPPKLQPSAPPHEIFDDWSSNSDYPNVPPPPMHYRPSPVRIREDSISAQGLEEDDSSVEDEVTLKNNPGGGGGWSGTSNHDSTSDVSTSSSERPQSLRDSSTRCNGDFQWIRKETETEMSTSSTSLPQNTTDLPPPSPMEEVVTKPPINRSKTPRRDNNKTSAPGSLDRRRPTSGHHHQPVNRQERDQRSRSQHVPKSPPRLDDFAPCQNWCCNPHDYACFENFHRRHERSDPQRYGSSPMLMESRGGSHPDLYGGGDCGGARFRHDQFNMSGGGAGGGCCGGGYHVAAPPPPPPCCYYPWAPPHPYLKQQQQPPGEHDEKLRKLQFEKENLQLQVQVLTDQIEAQGDKICDLEKTLHDRKMTLSETEEKLQREVLSRSSLETQKLELMSIVSELKLQQAAVERENLELRSHLNNNGDVKKPPLMPRMTSTPVHHSTSTNQVITMRMSPSPSPVILSGNSPRHQDQVQPPKTPPANYKRQIDLHYGSLPRQQFISNGSNNAMSSSVVDSNANPASSANGSNKKGVAFGRGLSSLLLGGRTRGFSVPNLAETEKIVIEDGVGDSTLQFNKNKGIKKIFGRMKRSGSGNLEELPGINEFQRGGVRATAAARLGWSEPHLTAKPDKPFTEWDGENICDWLQDLGLDQYIPDAKRWVKSGQQLQEASIIEIEKELNIKNPLHKKKLQLALIDTQPNGSSDPYLNQAGQLDTAWVLRWLDDTGLPQHKETFLINRVDGRVLHRLTVDDLALLHITSMLHVASIKRGIQVLRENNYEPGCLQRRSLPDEPGVPSARQISLWTTHRVMEWLRAVDLAEYAPNLRGAGVHGGLMVHETKFTGELLAALLSIPPGKTLLRRHLNTRFNELLGKDVIQEKRDAESTLGYIPLTPASKLKVAKKSQFSLKRKKSKGEVDYGDLVCPLNPDKSGDLNGSALNSSGMTRMESLRAEGVCHHHVEQNVVRSSPASIANSPVPQRHV